MPHVIFTYHLDKHIRILNGHCLTGQTLEAISNVKAKHKIQRELVVHRTWYLFPSNFF